MRKKLERFLIENGFDIKYYDLINYKNYGGKGWRNSGTYQEEVYKISKDNKVYYLHDKCMGRPRFTLTDKYESEIYLLDFSQQEFINRFEREILKIN